MLKLNSSTLAIWCKELTHLKRPWCWERLTEGGEGENRGWDGWMTSLIQWTWVWVNSGSWWWTGRTGVLHPMGSKRVRHDWATELTEAGNSGSIPGSGRSPGEGNGNPLQYSCLGNSMDRRSWWTTVHGVTKSWTRLKKLSTHTQLPDSFDIFRVTWQVAWQVGLKQFASTFPSLPLFSSCYLISATPSWYSS